MTVMVRKLKASDLNRRITIQRKVRTEDEAGYPIPGAKEWEDLCTLWAAREPLRGREFFAAAAVQQENTTRFRIRFREGITADMRLINGEVNVNGQEKERVYNIYAVLDDPHGDRTETHLMTTEELQNG